jgi:hypothetical protein
VIALAVEVLEIPALVHGSRRLVENRRDLAIVMGEGA